MLRLLERFETVINSILLAAMALIVLLFTVNLVWMLGADLLTHSGLGFTSQQLLDLFGDILLILIGLELMHSVKVYLEDHQVHVEVILSIALVALARKLIVLDVKQFDPLSLLGLAAVILALAVSQYLVRLQRRQSRMQA